jgi:hypothetical protein
MSEKPPAEIWTLAQSHDVKLVPTAGLPKYVLAEKETKMSDIKPPDICILRHAIGEMLAKKPEWVAWCEAFVNAFDELESLRLLVTSERESAEKRIAELEAQVTNQISTIEGLKNLDAMTCGCKYNKVWMGTKWEHYFVGCKEHGKAKIAELEAELTRECEAVLELLEACEVARENLMQSGQWKDEGAIAFNRIMVALTKAKAGEKGE